MSVFKHLPMFSSCDVGVHISSTVLIMLEYCRVCGQNTGLIQFIPVRNRFTAVPSEFMTGFSRVRVPYMICGGN